MNDDAAKSIQTLKPPENEWRTVFADKDRALKAAPHLAGCVEGDYASIRWRSPLHPDVTAWQLMIGASLLLGYHSVHAMFADAHYPVYFEQVERILSQPDPSAFLRGLLAMKDLK